MESVILFRRPRKMINSKLSKCNYVKNSQKFKYSMISMSSTSNNTLHTLNNMKFSLINTKPNYINKNKIKHFNKHVKQSNNNNPFNCLFIKNYHTTNNNYTKNQYQLEITNQLQLSNHTQIRHDLHQLKCINNNNNNNNNERKFTKYSFNDILQLIPKSIKRLPLHHSLLLIANELKNVLMKTTTNMDIICSIQKLPKFGHQSINQYNNHNNSHYVIILKEKINNNEIICSSEDNSMKLRKFSKNIKCNAFNETTNIKPEQVKLLESYYSGGNSVSLEACQLKYLPDLSSFYITLRFLNLSRNYLEDLPNDFCFLNNLEFLSLRFNPLRKVPRSIVKLKNLKSLNLSYCLIESLSYKFYDLTSLELLDLSYNRLEYLDSRINRLEHLKVLTLSGNDLLGIPPGLLCLCEKTLECLNLDNNPLLCLLPKELHNNTSIKIQSLKVLVNLKIRDRLHSNNLQNHEVHNDNSQQCLLITSLHENNQNVFKFQTISNKEESNLFNNLLIPIGSCCWCGLDRYDQNTTICKHCVDVFNYTTVPISILCCGIQCLNEVNKCSTAEQFAKRFYKSY
ncbi:Leucine-rich repeat-containing protein 63 [Schistosoma japonicum]|nr:Leucine-rich repeat-containing protein 63 [Schistosoma japonicum]